MDVIQCVIQTLTENPSAALCLGFALLYAAYYFLYVGKRPEIACGDEDLRQFIDQHCPISREKYWPTWWCIESHAQTLVRTALQSDLPIVYTGELVRTQDGGEILLDWHDCEETSPYPSETRPTIVFLPGLTGSSKENYILHLVSDASQMGYRSVVFNNRGTGDSSLKTPRTYCAANVDDLTLVVSHIREKYPQAPLIGVGISLGGMILFNYLARVGSQTDLLAAMIFSPAYDLHESSSSLDRPLNYWLFNRQLAHSLCDIFRRNIDTFERHLDIDPAHVLESESIKDFDERLTIKLFGFESAEHYYKAACLSSKVHTLAKPVVCLSAADDPFAPEYSIPTALAQRSPNIAIIKTSHGGHIGFLEGFFPRNSNYMNRWFQQFVSAVFQHGIQSE
ncbi:unnamed protein product [Candidula unifasciata]|uniref:Phospholipase ABHD3 n=1 Tax=Candidula unifasciata TaxID=100452 RepID=A0A8S3ZV94_9EUPU|nr:unnamed protein product [Candidula unifasciata]